MQISPARCPHGAVAMARVILKQLAPQTHEGRPCCLERVSIQLLDGSVWRLDALRPHDEQPMTMRQAARDLKTDRLLPNHFKVWLQIVPAKHRQAPVLT